MVPGPETRSIAGSGDSVHPHLDNLINIRLVTSFVLLSLKKKQLPNIYRSRVYIGFQHPFKKKLGFQQVIWIGSSI